MPAKINRTGQRFARLLIAEILPTKRGSYRKYARCLCDCGKEIVTMLESVVRGNTKSCGCVKTESNRSRGDGRSNDPLHGVYYGMRQRCENENNHGYKDYGGRGIYVCYDWRGSFDAFREWAKSNGYRQGLQIDRRDNSGPYSPENCRWVDSQTNNNNTRSNVVITYNEKTQTLSQWARETGVHKNTLSARLAAGYPLDIVFSTEGQWNRKGRPRPPGTR